MKNIAIGTFLACVALAANATPTELVVNGDFETGTLSNWTLSENRFFSSVSYDYVTHSQVWMDGAVGSKAYLAQYIATVVGQTYNFSFDVKNNLDLGTAFEADFGASKVLGTSNQIENWTHYSFNNLIATSSSTLIKIGIQNDYTYTSLDNVSVTVAPPVPNINVAAMPPVPEPESYAMLLAGLAVMGAIARRRKAKQA
jgi:hypothetical protein